LTLKSKLYFISDVHLGLPDPAGGRKKEQILVNWLDEVKQDASELFLVGDIFDFWFEYRHVVPKGYVRFIGKLAELADSGIKIHYFTGNHDLWIFDYLPKELGIQVYRKEHLFERQGKKIFVAHGDGLGPGDPGYKFLKKVFTNKILQFMFRNFLHPDWGVGFGRSWSHKSRYSQSKVRSFLGEKEWLVQYSRKILSEQDINIFVYGHRHKEVEYPMSDRCTYYNLGEWIYTMSYLVFENGKSELKYYKA
jgi:UDP-2,3-diacylglucosamine hydrolase